MKRRGFIKLSGCLFAGCIAQKMSIASTNNDSNRPLIMAVFPRRNTKATFQLFSPLAKHLSRELNREVRLETSRNFDQFWQGIKTQRYDLVHYNQYQYVISKELYNYQVIAKNHEFGRGTIAGSITVRKDSGIDSIEDLRGKTILFGGGKMAMQSYITAKWLLKQGGLEDGDFIEKIAVNPPNAIMSTYRKQADAAGSGDVILRMEVVKDSIDVTEMKYLALSKQLSHLPWSVNNNLDEQLKIKIQQILTSLSQNPAGQIILDQAKISQLSKATDSDYDEHRKIIRSVYGDDYGVQNLK